MSTIFSLTKYDASVVAPYFSRSPRRKLAVSLTVQNLQKKKFLYFHLPYFVPPAPYFHLTKLDVLPGLSQHPFHYYFCSV